MNPKHLAALALVVLLLMASSCTAISPPPTPTPTATATPTRVPTATPRPTATPTATPEPATSTRTLADGSTEFTDRELGYTVVLPPEWILLALGAGDLESMIQQAGAANPELAPLLESTASLAAQGMRFMSMDPDPRMVRIGFMPIINMTALGDLGLPLDFVLEGMAMSVESMFPGGEVVAYEMIDDLNGQPAGRIEARMPLTTMYGTQVTARITMIIVEAAGQALELSLGCEESFYEEYQPVFEETIGSLTITAP